MIAQELDTLVLYTWVHSKGNKKNPEHFFILLSLHTIVFFQLEYVCCEINIYVFSSTWMEQIVSISSFGSIRNLRYTFIKMEPR